MILEFAIFASSCWLISLFWNYLNLPKDLPPGPLKLPYVGSIIQVAMASRKKMPFQTFQEFSKNYGPVVSLKFGVLDNVVLEDCQIIKDVLSNEIWVDRYFDEWIARRSMGKQLGILVVSGPVWKEMRRFSIRTLRDFGFGKQKSMELSLQEELEDLTQSLTMAVSRGGGESIVNMKQYFTISVLNILWVMIAGTRFCHDNKKLHRLLSLMDKVVRANAIGSVPLTFYTAFPSFQRFLPMLTSHGKERYTLFKELHDFFRDILNERRAEGLYHEQRDFIDVFLCEINVHKHESPEANLYTDDQFIVVCMDLFMAGSETTSNTIEFALLYMIRNPEIMKKVQAEIDSVIGKERFPSILDKPNMPYTEATLLEVQRLSSVVPIIVRSTTQDTSIQEFRIPKGTIAIINIYGAHMNDKVWENPEIFDPMRFLDESNNVINAHKIIPFGFGRRVCIGEVLAKTSLFTFFTTFLQKFIFEASPDHPIPTLEPALGFTLSPTPYHAMVKSRF